jgi:adenine phosphoribosyltransferase
MTEYDLCKFIDDKPHNGVVFKDIGPVMRDVDVFNYAIDVMVRPWLEEDISAIGMLDARGFIFGTAIAIDLGVPFFMIRKSGKLPGPVHEEDYSLEYGKSTIAIAHDAFEEGSRVLLVDDVLATGGTAAAAARLVTRAGGEVVGLAALIELSYCKGREVFKHPISACVVY